MSLGGCSAGLFPGALPEKLILNLRRKEEAALAGDNEDSVTISRMLILGCRIEIDILPLSTLRACDNDSSTCWQMTQTHHS